MKKISSTKISLKGNKIIKNFLSLSNYAKEKVYLIKKNKYLLFNLI